MLEVIYEKNRSITDIERTDKGFILHSEIGMHRICPITNNIIRITYTAKEWSESCKPGVIHNAFYDGWKICEDKEKIVISSSVIKLVIDRKTASYSYFNISDGERLLLKEKEHESKSLEEFQAYTVDEESEISTEKISTADGIKEVVRDAIRIPYKILYHTRTYYEWQDDEALYGLGQQEEGLLNLRGSTVYVHQANRKIAVPMLVSSKGYGILTDTYSPLIFNDNEYGSYIYTEADEELDYYFIAGASLNDVVKGYRYLTGKAAMLPKWAFGYIQSQERYETAEEILEISHKYREKGIGLDCIVLDWCSWEDGKWGQKSFDKKRFGNPEQMIEKLHDMNIHFMISIWPNMDKSTDNYAEMSGNKCLLPSSEIYNALSKEGRKLYWKQVNEGLFEKGVDAWWCDSSEPLTVEWMHKERMEPAVMYVEFCKELQNILPADMTNSYSFFHAMTIYEGQRSVGKAGESKRVCNLTRAAYTGQQRYGTILWSGDTDASWDTYRKQIACGLNFAASGLPYWTVDIGAFFVKNGNCWYWKGEYDRTNQDLGYQELFTRWYQWGAFLPVFRGHGTDCRRELWEYTGADNMFYDAMVKINELRYKLMPYIYSQAGKVWIYDDSMIKMLAFDYGYDNNVLDIKDQYMFGESIMVCPVTDAMYYGNDNESISHNTSKTRKVYLPKSNDWYDYWTHEYYEGGQWITAQAPIDIIPLYVRAGSIIPVTTVKDHVAAHDDISFEVYSGVDCEYELYSDSGDGYDYENGKYSLTRYIWKDEEKRLYDESGACVAVDKLYSR